MKRIVLGAALLTLSLTGCGPKPRVEIATPDAAELQPCLEVAVEVPELTPLEPFQLPDGRWVVLHDVVLDRDDDTARWILAEHQGRMICRSAAVYVGDWIDEAKR